MNIKYAVSAVLLSASLAGCGSGDINIDPRTVVENSNNTTNTGTTAPTNSNDACASYANTGGQVIEGVYDGTNCTYSPAFVDAGNNLTVDMTIPLLPGNGAHIFEGSLFVGDTYDSDDAMMAAGISEGGDGPVLTVEAGATLAFQASSDFMIINRGSQLFAVGTVNNPITFTSVSDVTDTLPSFDAVQQWGGMVINGFGVTNKCAYTGTAAGDDLVTTDCHVDAEGAAGLDESQYGGDNNDDSSGRLEYVLVKHTGATVGNGDELNGITFGAVGRNTIVENLQVYSTFDDGIEMFGGAVNFKNYLALYVRDDSIDIDEGWAGTIENALVVQPVDIGNHCIEADGIGSFSSLTASAVEDVITQGINSRATIKNLTCIVSSSAVQGEIGQGAGWRLREGVFVDISDSLVVSSFGADSLDPNYCLQLDNRTLQAAQDGNVNISSSVFACEQPTNGNSLPNGTTVEQFAIDAGNVFATLTGQTDPTAAANTELQLLEGTPAIFSIDYATMSVDGATLAGAPQDGVYIGGLSLGDINWTLGWTFGLYDGARDVALWIE